jgi:hypothetical protein
VSNCAFGTLQDKDHARENLEVAQKSEVGKHGGHQFRGLSVLFLSALTASAIQFNSPSLVFALSFSLAVLSTGVHLTTRRSRR